MKGICIYGNQIPHQNTQYYHFWGIKRGFHRKKWRFISRSKEGGVFLATKLQESQL